MDKSKSGILQAVHEIASGLHRAGAISRTRMGEYDMLCLQPVDPLPFETIRQIREAANVSQAVFARYLNTSLSSVQKWETGQKRPGGAALKLLHIVRKRGLDAVA